MYPCQFANSQIMKVRLCIFFFFPRFHRGRGIYSPPKFNGWNLKMMGFFKRNLLFQGLLFRFHVKFLGCTSNIIFMFHDSCLLLLPGFVLQVQPYKGRAEAFLHPFPKSCSPNCPYQYLLSVCSEIWGSWGEVDDCIRLHTTAIYAMST